MLARSLALGLMVLAISLPLVSRGADHEGMSAGHIEDEPPAASPDEAIPPPPPRPRACPEETLISGVDISHYQGTVNFEGLETAKQTFVFIKATEGLKGLDPKYSQNWQKAGASRILRGPYHYFLPDQDPVAQARHFAASIGLTPANDLPPVFDWEDVTDLSADRNVSAARVFLTELERITGVLPILYTSPGYWHRVGEPAGFSRYPLFVAQYGVNCPEELKNMKRWVFWQKSEKGQAAGITGRVDLDVFQGSQDALWLVRSLWTRFFFDAPEKPAVFRPEINEQIPQPNS